jgi:hypothetical protein
MPTFSSPTRPLGASITLHSLTPASSPEPAATIKGAHPLHVATPPLEAPALPRSPSPAPVGRSKALQWTDSSPSSPVGEGPGFPTTASYRDVLLASSRKDLPLAPVLAQPRPDISGPDWQVYESRRARR